MSLITVAARRVVLTFCQIGKKDYEREALQPAGQTPPAATALVVIGLFTTPIETCYHGIRVELRGPP